MRKIFAFLALVLIVSQSFAQSKKGQHNVPNRPKLVVGIVVDQMRWDYLYRYYDRYSADGGFKRLLHNGFTCENTFIPYTPTYTACGHTCVYTGSVPAIHGITGNNWYDNELKRTVYCAEDKSVKSVGTTTDAGVMSPKNMLATTVADELRLATNFRSKVVGVAIKDRGAILPAGHSANGAYWYDSKTGDFITSTFYMNDLPQWVKDFNSQRLVDKYYEQGWNLLYPANTYVQSTADEKPYEAKPFGSDQKGFPYDLKRFIGKSYGSVSSTPYGNTLTAEMAKAAVINEQLGADEITDFLAVSFSSPDYIGHAFGPNSMEAEDGFLRLDKELGSLFDFLDNKVGKGQYLLFISADHGVSHVPGFNNENRLPGGTVDDGKWLKELEPKLQAAFGSSKLITGSWNNMVTLNHGLIDSLKLDERAVKKLIVDYLSHQPGVSRAFALDDLNTIPLNETIRARINNGYYPRRCGDIQFVLQPAYFDGGSTGTTHGLWNPYDSHIPLVWYGWGVKPGKTNRETYMTDIAPTIAAMLRIQMPSGNVGHVISEVAE
ncbi:alkaline phosphatase PafA [Pseudobacter ginsenosidimutans]|uniref:glycerophosphocholine cholinephosphodiesterase n=1 Tax=Pseudobacter ginsenosidimutans TaxID=661488 RepID=A0A4Q7MFY2_9BACT|nr:alkaline phosphatase PafA [Pseudobacter ginsenosidimutans]QEC45517.1 alkaline phosphatase family protein [Pseudobacter ginsenosidimutans]RZS67054.1 putative AlkP superfamily pyrophosphatase or phosphodiesterase [Pseudobacter ginsenosidimutans]